MPRKGELPSERLARAVPLAGTQGQVYVERRGIPLALADLAGMRLDPDWDGRAAVLVGLHDQDNVLLSVHGRYLTTVRGQNKLLTVGLPRGIAGVEHPAGCGRASRHARMVA